MCLFLFFFKQKTAYEMRISDWSSDVCSSDLAVKLVAVQHQQAAPVGGHVDAMLDYLDPAEVEPGIVPEQFVMVARNVDDARAVLGHLQQIGRASCRERVCQYV